MHIQKYYRSVIYLHSISRFRFFTKRKIALVLLITPIFILFLKNFVFSEMEEVPILDVPSHLFNFPGPLKDVALNPIPRGSHILFLEFGALRMTIPAMISMSASETDFDWKVDYLKDSLRFIADRFKSLSETNEKFGPLEPELIEVNNKLNELKKGATSVSRFTDFAQNGGEDSKLKIFLESIGNWFRNLVILYKKEMDVSIKECVFRMRNLEHQIAERIYEIQLGKLCTQSIGVLQLKSTTFRFPVKKIS